jgi:hypothetical protein
VLSEDLCPAGFNSALFATRFEGGKSAGAGEQQVSNGPTTKSLIKRSKKRRLSDTNATRQDNHRCTRASCNDQSRFVAKCICRFGSANGSLVGIGQGLVNARWWRL